MSIIYGPFFLFLFAASLEEEIPQSLSGLNEAIEKDRKRMRKRSQKFQAQDSVFVEGMQTSSLEQFEDWNF